MKRFALVPRVAAMPTKKKTTAARPQKDARRDQSAAINPPAPDINIAALGEDLLAVCLSFVKAQGSAATNLPAIVKLAVRARPPPPPPPPPPPAAAAAAAVWLSVGADLAPLAVTQCHSLCVPQHETASASPPWCWMCLLHAADCCRCYARLVFVAPLRLPRRPRRAPHPVDPSSALTV